MNQLTALRHRLDRLRRRRRLRRWATAYSAAASGGLALLAAALGCDWLLALTAIQRIVLFAACVGAEVWIVRRLAAPWLGVREGQLDVALLVERRETIDSDLIAALQFEDPAAPSWGSLELENAVVKQVDGSSRRWAIEGREDARPLRRRSLALATVVGLWIALAWLAPDHVRVFVERLLLGSQRYPSRTWIETIMVNGREIDRDALQDAPITVAFGRSVEFAAACGGRLPPGAEVQLRAGDGRRSLVPLVPDAAAPSRYRGELTRLSESVRFRFRAGDAESDWGELAVAPLPVAVQELEVTPPPYAAGQESGRLSRGLGQAEVLEGSRVVVRVLCEKGLSEGALEVDQRRYAFRPERTDGGKYAREWILDSRESPLTAVLQPVQYRIDVIDRDGLRPEQPLEGWVRIKPDAPPRAAAAVVTQVVLPTAKPTIYYRAADDLAIGQIGLAWEIESAGGEKSRGEAALFKAGGDADFVRDREATHEFDLAPLKLAKGDKLAARIMVVDYRGPRPGQQAASEPLLFQVTDQQGILNVMLESDRRSAEQLKEMITRQLGVGGSR